METLYSQIYKKYTDLKKRKLLDEGLALKREAEFKEVFDTLKTLASEAKKENDDLYRKLMDNQNELEKVRMELLEDIRAKDRENLRLRHLLTEKTDNNNSTATGSLNRTPEVIPENPTPTPPTKKTPQSNRKTKKTLQSNSKTKRIRLNEEAIVPYSSSPEEEARELECSRRLTCTTGNGTYESSSVHMFQLLVESLLRMKISLNKETERFSVSVSHEASGYSFTLTWIENSSGDEWLYKLSSLGTLKGVALPWMKHDIRFSMNMCGLFFERISDVIKQY